MQNNYVQAILKSCTQISAQQLKRELESLEGVQSGATKLIKGPEKWELGGKVENCDYSGLKTIEGWRVN